MKSKSRLLKVSLIGLSAITAAAIAACSTSDAGDDSAAGGTGGTSATGGSVGTAGTGTAGSTPIAGSTSTGGSAGAVGTAGTGGGGVVAMGTACPKPTMELITDFTPTDAGADANSFGDFTTTFSGSTFVYPNGTAAFPLTSDTTGGNWHITGSVGDYSGLGLALSLSTGGCNLVDASGFSGISFSIKGSVPIAGAQADSVQLTIGTAADDVASTWLNEHKTAGATDVAANFGTCMPVSNQYDGTCGAPTFKVPVTATATVINVKWTDLTGGKPMASIDPAKITFITWVIPTPPGVGMTPTTYDLDLTIDDLKFLPL